MRRGDNPMEISIHALREEGDSAKDAQQTETQKFLSTPSARRATHGKREEALEAEYFYPRPPRGGRLLEQILLASPVGISIHALREEGDPTTPPRGSYNSGFLSTPSARRATVPMVAARKGPGSISIHALREEGDAAIAARRPLSNDFYPRPPRGGRQSSVCSSSMDLIFLSTPSARRATGRSASSSIRASDFYPRPPRGGRPLTSKETRYGQDFYPRPPRGGRRPSLQLCASWRPFLSTPSARRATAKTEKNISAFVSL